MMVELHYVVLYVKPSDGGLGMGMMEVEVSGVFLWAGSGQRVARVQFCLVPCPQVRERKVLPLA
jgi:hypothetical protein